MFGSKVLISMSSGTAGALAVVLLPHAWEMQGKVIEADTVETQALILKDKAGLKRASLTTSGDKVELSLFDGKLEKVSVAVTEEGHAALFLSNGSSGGTTILQMKGGGLVMNSVKDGQRRLTMKVTDMETSIQFLDSEGRDRCWIGKRENGEAGLRTMDPSGKRGVWLMSTANTAMMTVKDDEPNIRVAVGVGEDGSAGVRVLDARQKDAVSIRTREQGERGLEVLDGQGKRVWYAGTTGDGQSTVDSPTEKKQKR